MNFTASAESFQTVTISLERSTSIYKTRIIFNCKVLSSPAFGVQYNISTGPQRLHLFVCFRGVFNADKMYKGLFSPVV